MTYIGTSVKDAALNYIKFNTTELHYCSAFPTTYAEASLTYSLGYKNGPTITGPTGDPRTITITGFQDATATGVGVAKYYALVSALELLAVGPLNSDLNVSTGETLGMPNIAIETESVLI